MYFKKWIDENKVDLKLLAEFTGIELQNLVNYYEGRRNPCHDMAMTLHIFTDGDLDYVKLRFSQKIVELMKAGIVSEDININDYFRPEEKKHELTEEEKQEKRRLESLEFLNSIT